MAEGRTNRGIARRLWLTGRTVETHVISILASSASAQTKKTTAASSQSSRLPQPPPQPGRLTTATPTLPSTLR
jgi:hypothetical protein